MSAADERLGKLSTILEGKTSRPRLDQLPGMAQPPPTQSPAGQATTRPATSRPESVTKQPKPPRVDPDHPRAIHRIVFRAEPDLRDRIDQAAQANKTSRLEVVLSAIEYAVKNNKLEDAVQRSQERAAAAGRPAGELFIRQRRSVATPKVLIELRLSPENVATLDTIRQQFNATNRTQLIHAALGTYLP